MCVINRDEGHRPTEALFAKRLSVLFFSLPASHLPGWGVSRWLRLKERSDAEAQGGQEVWTLIFEVILIPRTSVVCFHQTDVAEDDIRHQQLRHARCVLRAVKTLGGCLFDSTEHMKKGARTCAAHAHWKVTECGGCFYSPAATGHPQLPLELMELPLGFFPPQTGPAGGDPPPSAGATPPPSQLLPPRLTALPLGVLGPRGGSRRGRTTVMTLRDLVRFTRRTAAIGRGQ